MAKTKFMRNGVEIGRSDWSSRQSKTKGCVSGTSEPSQSKVSNLKSSKSPGKGGGESTRAGKAVGGSRKSRTPVKAGVESKNSTTPGNVGGSKKSRTRVKAGGESKKRKRDEIDPESETVELDPPQRDEEAEVDEGDEHAEVEGGEEDAEVEGGDEDAEDVDGHGGIEEETCRTLSILFGDVARNDDCEVDADIGDEYAWDEDNIPDPMSSDEENEEEMRPSEPYRESSDPEELLQLGKTFSDAEEFKHACLRYTLKTRYNIMFCRSSSLKMGATCAATMRDDEDPCPWMVYCSYEKRKNKLQIKTFVNVHRCEISGQAKLLKRRAIAELFAERLRLNPKMKPVEIQAEILREYKLEAKENSCIKAKTMLMKERRKTHESHFDRIWDYQAEVLERNRDSTFEIETIPGPKVGSKQRFYRMYICFKAQKESWKKTCRPVIGLDGAFLKWDIKGQLLAAVGRDGDNRIVPIAWAVVEIENDTNWDWFVKLLAADLELGYGKDYVLMSDKQKGLVKAIATVLPEAEHRQCCRHIYENWRKGGKDLRLQRLFWNIAKSYTPGLFRHHMESMKEYDPSAYASLVLTKPETWSRAFFRLGSQCNDNLNNLSESFNKSIRDARKKPLLDLLEDIRQQCMSRNYSRSKLAKDLKTRFTKKTHKQLDLVEQKATECRLRWAIGPETEVEYKGHSYVVSMESQTCACRSWQMNGIPCIHAAKVILGLGRKLSEYVADCYTTIRWRETYSFGIKPLNGILEWPQTNRLGVIPPPNRNGNPGRPRNHDRMKSMHETGSRTKLSRANRIVTCSKCKEEGHNKTTCSNETVDSPPKKPRGRPKKNQGLHFDVSHFSFAQVAQSSQAQSSQAQSSQPQSSQASRWEQRSQDQASQNQASHTRGWGHWFP